VKQVAAQVGRPVKLGVRAEVAATAKAAMMMEYCILNVLEGLEGWFVVVVCGFESLCWSCSELKLLDDDELERERGEFIYFFLSNDPRSRSCSSWKSTCNLGAAQLERGKAVTDGIMDSMIFIQELYQSINHLTITTLSFRLNILILSLVALLCPFPSYLGLPAWMY
jgi:hypothetical protein